MHLHKKLLLILALVASGTSQACLWDSETLDTESKRFPEAAGMMSGNFPRHSKEFHEWRAKQKKALVDAGAASILDYDDLAVSQHKLGDHQAAITTMLAKEKKSPGIYETHSNLGTFYIYSGDLLTAQRYIEKALSINPNAHFGREKYQRWLVMWLQEGKEPAPVELSEREKHIIASKGAPKGFAAFIARQEMGGIPATSATPLQFTEVQRQAAITGVTGMMYFADFDNPILQEALGDLLSFGTMEVNAAQLAALCYLHASEKASSPEEKSRLRNQMIRALVLVPKAKDAKVEPEMLETLNSALSHGQKLNEEVRTNEIAWIAAGKDAALEYKKKYLQPSAAK